MMTLNLYLPILPLDSGPVVFRFFSFQANDRFISTGLRTMEAILHRAEFFGTNIWEKFARILL